MDENRNVLGNFCESMTIFDHNSIAKLNFKYFWKGCWQKYRYIHT